MRKLFLQQIILLSLLMISNWTYAEISAPNQRQYARQENKNMLGVFFGGTNNEGNNYFTYGFEYHRLFATTLGFSIIAEDVPNNMESQHEVELVGLLTLNAYKNFILGVGPGLEFEKGKSTEVLGRISLGYIFLFGNNFEFTPSVDYNYINGQPNQLIYGITLGKQF